VEENTAGMEEEEEKLKVITIPADSNWIFDFNYIIFCSDMQMKIKNKLLLFVKTTYAGWEQSNQPIERAFINFGVHWQSFFALVTQKKFLLVQTHRAKSRNSTLHCCRRKTYFTDYSFAINLNLGICSHKLRLSKCLTL
jgi:hypothetical protein